jgi:MoaA/NifB/PqqE/SkfB family radical SAM enzyme
VGRGLKLHLYLPAYPAPAFFHALESKLLRSPPGATTVVFSMTKACSYHCPHCYQRHDTGPDLPEERLLALARELQEAGVALFDLEGGEPLLRLPRLLRLLAVLDSRAEVWVNTTGAGLTPEAMQQLRAAGLYGFMVSIHSPRAEVHDQFTGVPGSFDLACRAVRLCRGTGGAAALNSVLAEDEIRRGGITELMALAKDLDADFVQLIHPKPAGLWLGRTEGMQRDAAFVAEVREQHRLYNSSRRREYPALAAQVFEEAERVLGCTAGGVDRFYVNATGEVQPCEFLNLSFGNVTREPFATVFARMRSCFPEPCSDWLCCTQAGAIAAALRQQGTGATPLSQEATREVVAQWDRGRPTPLYRRLGIYR